jgi:hypothetical protein
MCRTFHNIPHEMVCRFCVEYNAVIEFLRKWEWILNILAVWL